MKISTSRIYTQIRDRVWSLIPMLAVLYLLVLIVFIAIVILRLAYDVPMANLTRDIAQITGVNPFFGALSNIGVLLWCATAAICIFSSILFKEYTLAFGAVAFLLYAAFLTALLMLDDLFLIHDIVLPVFLGIDENWLYLLYAILTAIFLMLFYRIILKTDYIILVLAFVFFGLSLLVDLLHEQLPIPGIFLIEDGLKFLGITSWTTYFIRSCFQIAKLEIAKSP